MQNNNNVVHEGGGGGFFGGKATAGIFSLADIEPLSLTSRKVSTSSTRTSHLGGVAKKQKLRHSETAGGWINKKYVFFIK